MEIRQITSDYAVSPQIAPEDFPAIAEAGFTTVICNRPDAENPPELQGAAMIPAAEAAGVKFVYNPVVHGGMDRSNLEEQMQAAAEGKTLAYCASGTRSSVVWALAKAPELPADDILEATGRAGYALEGLRPQLEALSRR